MEDMLITANDPARILHCRLLAMKERITKMSEIRLKRV